MRPARSELAGKKTKSHTVAKILNSFRPLAFFYGQKRIRRRKTGVARSPPLLLFFVWPEKKLEGEKLALSLVPDAAVVLLALGGLVFLLLAYGGLGLLLVVTVLFALDGVPAGRGLRGRVVLVHLGRAAGGPSPLDAVVQALLGDEDGEDAGGEMMKKNNYSQD